MIRKLLYATIAVAALSSSALAEENAMAKFCTDKRLQDDIRQVIDNGPDGKRGIHLLLIRQPQFVDFKPGDSFTLTCSGIAYLSNGEEIPVKYGAKKIDDEVLVWFLPQEEDGGAASATKAKPKTTSRR